MKVALLLSVLSLPLQKSKNILKGQESPTLSLGNIEESKGPVPLAHHTEGCLVQAVMEADDGPPVRAEWIHHRSPPCTVDKGRLHLVGWAGTIQDWTAEAQWFHLNFRATGLHFICDQVSCSQLRVQDQISCSQLRVSCYLSSNQKWESWYSKDFSMPKRNHILPWDVLYELIKIAVKWC